MRESEQAERVAAWTWAAETLGVEMTEQRVAGLVEVTSSVRVENLKRAIERAMQTESGGFLPAPGKVIICATAIDRERQRETPRLGSGSDMTIENHRRWMAENNPEGWSNEQWTEFSRLIGVSTKYAAEVKKLRTQRGKWCLEELAKSMHGKRVSHSYRLQLITELSRDARMKFPNPDPLEWRGDA